MFIWTDSQWCFNFGEGRSPGGAWKKWWSPAGACQKIIEKTGLTKRVLWRIQFIIYREKLPLLCCEQHSLLFTDLCFSTGKLEISEPQNEKGNVSLSLCGIFQATHISLGSKKEASPLEGKYQRQHQERKDFIATLISFMCSKELPFISIFMSNRIILPVTSPYILPLVFFSRLINLSEAFELAVMEWVNSAAIGYTWTYAAEF